mgnify:CR=1 FL=1
MRATLLLLEGSWLRSRVAVTDRMHRSSLLNLTCCNFVRFLVRVCGLRITFDVSLILSPSHGQRINIGGCLFEFFLLRELVPVLLHIFVCHSLLCQFKFPHYSCFCISSRCVLILIEISLTCRFVLCYVQLFLVGARRILCC